MKTQATGKNRRLTTFLIVITALLIFCTASILAACSNDSSDDASGTNNQTAGVDEPDIVKVTADGYIFKAQSDGLTVSKAVNGQVEVIVKEVWGNFDARELFVTDDYLIALGNKYALNESADAYTMFGAVKFFDMNRLKSASRDYTARETEFNGELYTARIYQSNLYLVFKVANSKSGTANAYKDSLKGSKTFTIVNNGSSSTLPTYLSGFVIAKYNLDSLASGDITAIMYHGETITDIYCSPYAIYSIGYSYKNSGNYRRGGCYGGYWGDPGAHYSSINKISLENLTLLSTVEVYGSILSRYSLYDNGTDFYAVVSTGSATAVYAYDSNLVFKSKTEDFGLRETIYAVRFEENYCFVVTFRQVDPLFKIDIRNPFNMQILGELKIEGYSTFLQAFGDGLMMGVGFDADFRWGAGVKLTLFDTIGDAPLEIESVLFGSGSKADATNNPRAILCEPQNNLFAFAIEYRDGGGYGQIKQGAVIYGISDDGKLELRAFLTNFSATDYITASKKVTRVARIGSYIYAISDGYITSYDLEFNLIGMFDTRITY